MSTQNKNLQTLTVEERSVVYSAPLPEASQFAGYESTVQGAGERILAMAERQAGHRQHIEKWSIIGDQIRAMIGLVCGFFVAIAGLAGTVFLIFNGKEVAGSILGIGTLGSIVTSLIYGSQGKAKQMKKREQELNT